MELPFQQIFIPMDLATVGLLVILEGVLSIDNALVLGLLAKRLPKSQQGRALTYGLVGAFFFRFVAIATAQFLLKWTWVKLLGGAYLLYVAGKFFIVDMHKEKDEGVTLGADGTPILDDDNADQNFVGGNAAKSSSNPYASPEATSQVKAVEKKSLDMWFFWQTVLMIELTDMAFAVDSILAAIALVGPPPVAHAGFHPKLWVVVTGGMLGVILMRVAAVMFIKLLEKFPRFEISAYLLVAVIGIKLVADWQFNTPDAPHTLNFHSPSSPAFWIFWSSMLISLGFGFIPPKKKIEASA